MITALVISNLYSFDLNHPVTPTFYELSPRNMFTVISDSSIPASCDPTSLQNKIFQSYLGFGSVKGTGTPNISLGILNDGNGIAGNFRMVEPQGVPCPLGASLGQIQEPFKQTFRKHGTHHFSGRVSPGQKKTTQKKCRERLVGMELTYIFKATGPRFELNFFWEPEHQIFCS